MKIRIICAISFGLSAFIFQPNLSLARTERLKFVPADSTDYGRMRCEIKHVYKLEGISKIRKLNDSNTFYEKIMGYLGYSKHDFESSYIGRKFTVYRDTGIFEYMFIQPSMEYKILDAGSKENSFRSISYSKKGMRNNQYLQIDTFIDDLLKPMKIVASNYVFTGDCRLME
jgi:hypothetical protein